jgi:putative ABC transport system substrate-binding protein
MRRRELITLLGGAAAAWPMAARAHQPSGRVRRIGALIGRDESDPGLQADLAAFRSILSGLGWTEGRNLQIDWRFVTAGDASQARTHAQELIASRPDVIFATNTFIVAELQRATGTIPIVFAVVTDAIASGFVATLPRPGGNITGFSNQESPSLGKLAELIKEIVPNAKRVGIIHNRIPNTADLGAQEVVRATSLLGLQPISLSSGDARELESAIATFAQEPNGALIIPGDPVTFAHRKLIIATAAQHKIPAVFSTRDNVVDGGLLSYGIDRPEQFCGAAGYVDRILKGAKPAELPVQLPVKYQLVVNMKTARALGLEMPLSILMRIDEVIE